MQSWTTDAHHLPADDGLQISPAARARALFTREVIEAATSRASREAWRSAVRCIARAERRICRGWICVRACGADSIEWSCERCGDSGVIGGFAGGDSDLSAYVPRGKTVLWGFDDEERRLLSRFTTEIPGLRAIVARGRPHAEVDGLILVEATVRELDAIYTLVEDITDIARSSKQRELLDGLRASLCTSMDGF